VAAGASLDRNGLSIHDMLRIGQILDSTVTLTTSFDAVITPRLAGAHAFIDSESDANNGANTFQHVDRVPVTFDTSAYVRGYDPLGAKPGYHRQ